MAGAVYRSRWASGRHVGPAKPRQVVRIQRGHLSRSFQPFEFLDGSTEQFGVIWQGKHNGDPWHPVWHAFEDWITVPNVKEVTITKSLGDDGVVSAEVHIENVAHVAFDGIDGAYHVTDRGHYAPFRGALAPGRKSVPTNQWFDVLNGGHRIKIWQGYGDALEPVFCGLVDDTDVSASPDTITLTSRMGSVLVDEFVFGWAKAADIRSPITFAPRTGPKSPVLDFEKQGSAASASSSDLGYPSHNVNTSGTGYWRSQLHSTPNVTEWVQVRLPAGVYEDFYLDPHYDGMEVYISVYARGDVAGDPVTGGTVIVPARRDGVEIGDGWVTGGGMVPGDHGGHPCIRVAHDVTHAMRRKIGARLVLGNDSVLRLSFRKLQPSAESDVVSPSTRTGYRAGARRVLAYREVRKKHANCKGWVLIDDASDLVKWALMWAGFHEWEIESFGMNIVEPITFNQGDRLIDIVRAALAQGNYNFFIAAPTGHDLSMGVPIFRSARSVERSSPGQIEVRSTDLLTRLETKYATEGLHYVIRHRGRETKPPVGVQLGEDTSKRVQATYFPPWSGAHHSVVTGAFDFSYPYPGSGGGRLTGVMKHFTNTNDLLATEDECQVANLLVAIQEALGSYTATLEIPGYPLELDEHVSVIDPAGGVNNRVWTTHVQTTFTAGQDTSFVTSVGGSLIDSPDLLAIAIDYILLAARLRAQP